MNVHLTQIQSDFFWILDHEEAMRAIRINVDDDAVRKGHSMCLKCMYSLKEDEAINEIDWFKNGKPIYKYIETLYYPKEIFYQYFTRQKIFALM